MNDLGIPKKYQLDFSNSINELSKISYALNANEKFSILVNTSCIYI
jgi:hypothetical protein